MGRGRDHPSLWSMHGRTGTNAAGELLCFCKILNFPLVWTSPMRFFSSKRLQPTPPWPENVSLKIKMAPLLLQLTNVSPGSTMFTQLQNLREALVLARNTREIVAALALLQKAVEGLLDATSHSGVDQEVRGSVPVVCKSVSFSEIRDRLSLTCCPKPTWSASAGASKFLGCEGFLSDFPQTCPKR